MRSLPFVAVLAVATACVPRVPPRVEVRGVRQLNAWDVQKDGKTSTLLGTCHLGASLDYALPKPDSAAIEAARVVFTEADLGAMSGGEALGMMWTDDRLSARLSPAAWSRLIRGAPELPATILDHFPPWVAGTLGSLHGVFGPQKGDKALPMDLEVQRRAEAKGIPVRHVETLEQQVALLSGFDDAFIVAMEAPPDPAAAARSQHALDDLCMAGSGDVSALIDPTDPTTEPMLYARNRAWVPLLVPELEQGRVFVAVGAAHMLGEQGLVSLLQAQGFTLTRHTTTRPREKSAAFEEEKPREVVDEGRVERAQALLVPAVVTQLCADASVVRTCFIPDPAACQARMTKDATLCVSQAAASLPASGPPGMPLITSITTCAVTGVVTEAMVHDSFGDAPMCQSIKAGMAGAMKRGVGG